MKEPTWRSRKTLWRPARRFARGRPGEADLLGRLAADERIPQSKTQLEKLVSQSKRFVGAAPKQVDQFKRDAAKWARRFPESKKVRPGKML